MKFNRLFQIASNAGVCRDLDPRGPYWLVGGGLAGAVFYGMTSSPAALLNKLIHQRGPIQLISILTGGMVLGFVLFKLTLLTKEQVNINKNYTALTLDSSDKDAISGAQNKADAMRGVLARRWRLLLQLWKTTHSTTKVTNRLDADTEAFDLAQQNSYAFPRILVWAIPILGFLGTVIGIGSAVGQFDTFISNAEDIDVLRDGLAQVTGGLGTAFDTTFLALTISLVVMLPLAAVERLEQRLLTRIDLLLRHALLPVLPDNASSMGAGVNQQQLYSAVEEAFVRHLPTAEVLVEPAKIYAERAAAAITEHLDPIKSIASNAAAAITTAQQSVSDQTDLIKSSLEDGADRIDASIQSLYPLLEHLTKVEALSSVLDHELKQLQSGARLSESLQELKSMLATVDQTLIAASKPRKIVLTEQFDSESFGK
jgi:biopolymer transport protein ExbB/TolQ